ncbi:hypothetical protein A9Q84_12275 [Halobacteriovorax marinus]|uniref:ABC transporter permease n=1 Tax=Halobacteriovorax marinus TaxID=97084 RepID=A0A1Y5FDY6_9BACT|nr:hypothetical protein A9Q84_12275 [Halobacteriovorax marinus]
MNLLKTKALLHNTITKEYRNKALLFLLIFSLGVITLANALVNFISETFLVNNPQAAILGDKSFFVMFMVITFLTTLISVILGTSCIKSDFESSSIGQILAFPIQRVEYLGARIIGAWITSIMFFIISIGYTAFLFSLSTKASFISGPVILAILTASANLLTTITIAAILSLYLPKLFAFIFTFAIRILIGSSNAYFAKDSFSEIFQDMSVLKFFGAMIHFFFPRMQPMEVFTKELLEGKSVGLDNIALFGQYFVTYIILFSLLSLFFSRKEI